MSPASTERGPVNLFTVDVEDYFHANGLEVDPSTWDRLPARVEYTTRRMLALLAEHEVRATFFVLGWVASRFPYLVREIAAAGHEVASHGWGHRLVYDQTSREFGRDVADAKALLEDLSGREVIGYRAPSFSITKASRWALDVLLDTGYRYDSSIFPVRRGRYGDPEAQREVHWLLRERGQLLEVPPSTVVVAGRNVPVAGGGYLRFWPLAITRRAIATLNEREGMPAVLYVHPWEIDPDQPHMPATAGNRFRHYLNLDRTEDRLRSLMRQFRFDSIERALADDLARTEPAFRTTRRLA